MRLRRVNVIDPPGLDLKIPEDLDPETFCRQIGGDCDEYHDKFDNIQQIFELQGWEMKKRDVPTKQRKYIMSK